MIRVEIMMFDKRFILATMPDAKIVHDMLPQELSVSIDTRSLVEGDIFVALAGTRVDGHDFVEQAVQKGAAGLIINSDKQEVLRAIPHDQLQKMTVIVVQDTYKALLELARAWRAQFNCPIIGITGSIGKTSTKEMLAHIVSLTGKPFVATAGNYSSLLGLALSLLRMRPEHTLGIFEVGISKRGEMAQAVEMLKPTIAAITFIGHSHSEGLGSLADICNEKRTVFKHFKSDSVGVINGDQALLSHIGYAHPVIRFGAKSTNQIQARKVRVTSDHTDFILKIYKNKYPIRLSNPHDGAVYHALCAAGVAQLLGVDHALIIRGISMPIHMSGRFQQLALANGNGTVIHDAYNASPESVKAALLAVETIKTDAYKVAVLGDMLELGVDSLFWHRQVGRFLRKTPSIQEVVLVGIMIKAAQQLMPPTIKCTIVDTADQAVSLLNSMKQELLVLVKASRGIGLELVVDGLTKQQAQFSGAKRARDTASKPEEPGSHIHP